MDTSAADGGPPGAHSHPRLMRRCLHIVVVVRLPPPHFSPHAAPLPLTPPFRLPPPPLSIHCPFWTRSVHASLPGACLSRAWYVSCLAPRASMHVPSTPSCFPSLPPPPPHTTGLLLPPDRGTSVLMAMCLLAAQGDFLLDGRSDHSYRHSDLVLSPVCVWFVLPEATFYVCAMSVSGVRSRFVELIVGAGKSRGASGTHSPATVSTKLLQSLYVLKDHALDSEREA